MNYYDRYGLLRDGDNIDFPPFITISKRPTDIYIPYNSVRFDKLSDKHYQSPFYGFLIRYANPEFYEEYDIPDDYIIRIPLPLDEVRAEYHDKLRQTRNL